MRGMLTIWWLDGETMVVSIAFRDLTRVYHTGDDPNKPDLGPSPMPNR